MDIAAHIGQLVMEHECVIIPGLGAFLTNYHSAEINTQQNLISPPSKSLVFNAQLVSNDGILAHYLSQRLEISYKTSLMLLDIFSAYCHRDLAEGKKISFGDLGILDKNESNKLEFYPNTAINYNEDAFGLKPLTLKAVSHKPNYRLISPISEKEDKETRQKITLNTISFSRVAAVLIPLAIFVSTLFYFPTLKTNDNLQRSSILSYLNSSNTSLFTLDNLNNKEVVGNATVKILAESITNKEVNTVVEPLPEPKATRKPLEIIVKDLKSEAPQGQFHIICGSFGEKDRAEAMVNQLKSEGFKASIAGQSTYGTFRVSIQSFRYEEEASRQISWVRNHGFKKAWVLNKSF